MRVIPLPVCGKSQVFVAEELLKSHVQNLPEILPFVRQIYIYIYFFFSPPTDLLYIYIYLHVCNIYVHVHCQYMSIYIYVYFLCIIHVYVDKSIYSSIHAYVYTNMTVYLPKEFKHGYTFRWLGAILYSNRNRL